MTVVIDRQVPVDCFLMPKHSAENLIENTHKADKTSRIRKTDLTSCVLFVFTRSFSKLTNAKFRTFTCNSRTVTGRSSGMKF